MSVRFSVGILFLGAWISAACQTGRQATPHGEDSGIPIGADPYAPCTDFLKCCGDSYPCSGVDCDGADCGLSCACPELWDCSRSPSHCEQPLPVPPGGGDWTCTWTELKYACERPVEAGDGGPNPQDLPGGESWQCQQDGQTPRMVCVRRPPNPTNRPEGTAVWTCRAAEALLVCEREDSPPVGLDELGLWDCQSDGATGRFTCRKADSHGGLPPGGQDWQCNLVSTGGIPTWTCYGRASAPFDAGDWPCTPAESGADLLRCTRPQTTSDLPPGGGWYACAMGSLFGGTVCEKVPRKPAGPGSNDTCFPGDRMWCDGAVYDGWGMVECDPATGAWKTRMATQADGRQSTVLDCREDLPGGRRPNTYCACYHFYTNFSCCERPDCVVPAGTSGQVCPPSSGTLCAYCNPRQSECTESGAKCVVANTHESFCARLCSAQDPCPTGYSCMQVKQPSTVTIQCVPSDLSCYY